MANNVFFNDLKGNKSSFDILIELGRKANKILNSLYSLSNFIFALVG